MAGEAGEGDHDVLGRLAEDVCFVLLREGADVGCAGAGGHLAHEQLALDGHCGIEMPYLHHIDQLVQLLDDLFERSRLDVDHDGDATEPLVVRRRHGEGVDVESPAGEQAGNPRQHARLVLDPDHQGVEMVMFDRAHHEPVPDVPG